MPKLSRTGVSEDDFVDGELLPDLPVPNGPFASSSSSPGKSARFSGEAFSSSVLTIS
jgi:hypothetical protein